MKKYIPIFALVFVVLLSGCSKENQAARQERRAIKAGNALYTQGRYLEAAEKYKEAIEHNPNSMEAVYDLAMASLMRAETVESDSLKQQLTREGMAGLQTVASSSVSDPELAGKAVYNLGNYSFNEQKFPDAIQAYKQSLRFNSTDEEARRNLRIAQLQQNDDQNQDQNQDNQDQNQDQDKQDQNQDNQDQNQDRNQDQDKQDKQEQQQPQINQQSAEQILQSIDNKENQVRARMMQGQEASSSKSSNKRW